MYEAREDVLRDNTIEYLKKQREERLYKLAYDYGYTEDEIKEKYNNNKEEIYDMDDSDNFIQSIDNVLWCLGD